VDRDNIITVINFLRKVSEDFSVTADNLESYLTSTPGQIIPETESDLSNLLPTLLDTIQETHNIYLLVEEILP